MIMTLFITFKTTIIFLFFIFACVRLFCADTSKLFFDLLFFSELLRWRSLSDCWFQLNWWSKNLLFFNWKWLWSSLSRVQLSVVSCIITLNNIISLILSIFLIIKSLFFNIKVSLARNSINLWYLSKEDNSFFISFK